VASDLASDLASDRVCIEQLHSACAFPRVAHGGHNSDNSNGCNNSAPARCGRPAYFTQRLHRHPPSQRIEAAADVAVVAVGGAELYQPCCDFHHVPAPVVWPMPLVEPSPMS
jgi:hypothetical protein